jgi:ATPase subunit of ABC transporter with duplicated ATPase domains
MLILRNVSYIHPDKELLFDNINLTVNNHDKIALIGNNGSGKSTLLKIISGELKATGEVMTVTSPYYVPQIFGQFNHLTIAQALRVEEKLHALREILEGRATEELMDLLADDWTIDERCREALDRWQLKDLNLEQGMDTLSGGQRTKVFLAGISIHQPDFILLDEPSNHLDAVSRKLLYEFIESTSSTLLIVSHDRTLLNLLNTVCELNKQGIAVYGGNYDFYIDQKNTETIALNQDIKSKEKALRKAKERERETIERQKKLDARGKKKQEKAGIARIMMNTLRNNAEKSSSKIKSVHTEKIDGISQELHTLRSAVADLDKIKLGFEDSVLHKGKLLFTAVDINFAYKEHQLWRKNLSFQIASGERINLAGSNGSGKTTLINIILGQLSPSLGNTWRAINKAIYIDQDYSLIRNELTVYEQAQRYNEAALEEHEVKVRLNRFLFTKDDWNKPCSTLSGGERMRLILCCLNLGNNSPDVIILDEPTNNLDIQNIEILTIAIKEYRGTLIVVSHDTYFLEQIGIERTIYL